MPMFYVIVRGEHARSTARKITTELNIRDPRAIMDACDAPLKHFIASALNMKYEDLPLLSPVDVLGGMSPKEFVDTLAQGMAESVSVDFFGRLLVYRHLRLDSQTALSGPVRYVIAYDLVTEEDGSAFGANVKTIQADHVWEAADIKRLVMTIISERLGK